MAGGATMAASQDYYALLGVARDASADAIKKAYYQRALRFHPDKVIDPVERETATERFQELGHAYYVLSQPRLKQIYDQTGSVESEELRANTEDDGRDWEAYWRELFPPITAESIKTFEQQYKGSAEELADLQAAYRKCQGRMGEILEEMYFGSVEEEERYRGLLQPLIEAKTLPAYRDFTHEPAAAQKRRRKRAEAERAEAERAEAEAAASALNLKTDDDLSRMIRQRRQQEGHDLLAYLEAKYASPKAGKSKGSLQSSSSDMSRSKAGERRKRR